MAPGKSGAGQNKAAAVKQQDQDAARVAQLVEETAGEYPKMVYGTKGRVKIVANADEQARLAESDKSGKWSEDPHGTPETTGHKFKH